MGSNEVITAARPPADDIRLLRDRVDGLELKARERQTPWYKQLPLWISIISLFLATISSIYSVHQHNQDKQEEEIKKRLETLRATIIQMADVRSENLQALATSDPNSIQASQKFSVLNTKREVLIENADALLSGIEKEVSPAVFVELAYEEAADERFSEAAHYYNLGLQSKHLDLISNVAICRGLGELYAQPKTEIHDLNLSRANFQQASDVLKGHEGEYADYNRAYTFADRAFFEFANKNAVEGRSYLDQARTEESKIAATNPLRQQAHNLIVAAEQSSLSAANAKTNLPNSLLVDLMGHWEVRYQGDQTVNGILTVVASSDGKNLSAGLSAFRSGRLVKKYSGQVYLLDQTTVQVEWNGIEARPAMGAPVTYIFGVTSLRVSERGRAIGDEYPLGESSLRIILRRKAG